jgi:hypothetical protein
MRLIQFFHPEYGRRVGIVEEPNINMLDSPLASFDLFQNIINNNGSVSTLDGLGSGQLISYDDIYNCRNGFRILPPIDCPGHPMMCVLSGTGLTHKASAVNRQKMHEGQEKNELTDSMKMYLMGEEGGKPTANQIGAQPEWFYKGNGLSLKAHGEPLTVPGYADDGGEEPEIAGIYLVSEKGVHRLGFTQGNEFSDHIMERKNYLYLAPSKLRQCSIGPELVLQPEFISIPGEVSIIRQGSPYWTKKIVTGEDAMSHSLANLEHHHFKYAQHRIPGQLHIHFFGASAFSFGEKIELADGDEMSVSFQNMGRALVNPLAIESPIRSTTTVIPLLPGDQEK